MTLFFLAVLVLIAVAPLFLVLLKRGSPGSIIMLTLVLSVSSGFLYWQWGGFQGLRAQQGYERIQETLTSLHEDPNLSAELVRTRLSDLEQKMPANSVLWNKIGTLYQELKWQDQAERAFSKAYRLDPNNLHAVHNLLYVKSIMNQGIIPKDAQPLVDLLLESNPNDLPVINLLAMNAFKQGRYQEALDHWESVLRQLEPWALTERKTIKEMVDRAREHLGNIEELDSIPTQEPSVSIHVKVAPQLKASELDPNTPVFVYVRPAQGKMPLAVKKLSISELPCTITLDQKDAMRPEFGMKHDQMVIAGARIALSQQAMAQPGDWQGHSSTLKLTGNHQLELIINEIV